jgi:26S proteasome subunit RPN7/PCI domain
MIVWLHFCPEHGPNPSHPRARSGNVVYDHDFLVECESRNRGIRDLLSSRLHAAQAHLNKEAIRTAYLALAESDILRGDLPEAYHAALRAKDYCTNRQQTCQVSFLVLELAIHLQNYGQVRDFTFKVQHTLLTSSSSISSGTAANNSSGASSSTTMMMMDGGGPLIADKLLVTSALERLAHSDFAEAAAKFRQVCSGGHHHARSQQQQQQQQGSSNNNNNNNASPPLFAWETLIAPEDIATYAAVISMATASRKVLQEWIEQPEALEFLAPPLQEALFQLASRANYAAAWKQLQEFLPNLQLDLFLAPHLSKILIKIREAYILEYWIPYERVSLQKMALDLEFHSTGTDANNNNTNTNTAQLLTVVERLMRQGSLQDCRIDCRTQTLIRDPPKNPQHETRRKLQRLGDRVLDDTYAMIIRLACIESELVVMDPQQQKGGGRGRRGGGDAGAGGVEGGGFGDGDDDDTDNSDDGDTPMVDVSNNNNGPAIIGEDEPPEMGAQNPEDLY